MRKNILFLSLILLTGCSTSGNVGELQSYPAPSLEADWIRSGEAIEFEEELWYPKDGTETFLDSEVVFLMDYRNVQIFTDKKDVRPFNRLYTKFGKNKFRYFERRLEDDSY